MKNNDLNELDKVILVVLGIFTFIITISFVIHHIYVK